MNDPEEQAIEHPGETQGNEARGRLAQAEPRSLRTYTPSLAVIAEGEGSFVRTVDGRRLADFTSGVLVANLGHHPRGWWQRFMQYLGIPRDADEQKEFAAVPLTTYNAASQVEVEASERLLANLRAAPGGGRMEQVMWAASGSEAVQKALWAAMRYRPGADMVLATRGGFHGKKGLAGAVTGSEEDEERDPRVRFISFPKQECVDLERRAAPLNLTPYENELRQIAQEHGARIGCIITEPYLGGGGSFHPQPEYLQLLERYCREQNWLLILDEIQSNFGRTGPMYAFTRYGIEPDLVCLGKGLGNGVPVSAVCGPRTVFRTLHFGEGSDTWSGNPLSCAAVLATLDAFEHGDVLQQGTALSRVLEEGLARLRETPVVDCVRGEGCVWGVQCAAVGEHTAEEVANACVATCYRGTEDGIAIHLLGPLAGKVLRVSPPLNMDVADAKRHLSAMHDLFVELGERLADQPSADRQPTAQA